MSRVFLDANILLEILLDRKLASKCKSLASDPANEYGISALSVHIVWYVAEKYNLPTQLVDDLLSVWALLPVTNETAQLSRNRYDGKDFEDCMQAACAELGHYDEIVTIDKHFQAYSQTVLPVTVVK